MDLEYDKNADAAYLYLKKNKPQIVKNTKLISDDIMVDYDENNSILGIEFLNASKKFAKKDLQTIKT